MITQSELKQILDYDPETGVFRWKISPNNRAKKGSVAGNRHKDGTRIRINGKQFFARVLAWIYVYGVDPSGSCVTSVNKNVYDIRISNLLLESHIDMCRNFSKNRNNSSGINGVFWSETRSKWVAMIKLDGKNKHLGMFTNLTDAKKARQEANVKYGFAETHGEERCPF